MKVGSKLTAGTIEGRRRWFLREPARRCSPIYVQRLGLTEALGMTPTERFGHEDGRPSQLTLLGAYSEKEGAAGRLRGGLESTVACCRRARERRSGHTGLGGGGSNTGAEGRDQCGVRVAAGWPSCPPHCFSRVSPSVPWAKRGVAASLSSARMRRNCRTRVF